MKDVGRYNKYHRRSSVMAYVFIAPAMILLFAFSIFPMIASLGMGFFDVNIFLADAKFIGLGNFSEAFRDTRFINSIWVTIKFTLVEVPAQMLAGLLIAALVTRNTVLNKFFRGVYFMPIICSATAVGIMWKMFLNSEIGLFTYFLEQIGIKGVNFMNSTSLTFYVLVFMSIWKTFGISTIILVSAMQNVSADLYEASELDGCSKVRQFFSITLPLIKPTAVFVLMTRLIGSLQVFDLIFTTTGGGPNFTTESMVSYIYSRAFSTITRLGYASALSECLFVFIMIITIFLYWKMYTKENT